MAQPPHTLTPDHFVQAVDHIIRERRTAKILRDPDQCDDTAAALPPDFNDAVRAVVEVAGWAPFHKAVHKETHLQGTLRSVVPWRFYVLDKPACCTLLGYLRERAQAQPDSKWSRAWESKVPRLLAGTGALVQVTWLPDPPGASGIIELSENNVEHIAAAAAAVQNLMLAAEARGMHTYWATGGILKDSDVLRVLDIPASQSLLGAIYLAPDSVPHDERETGGMRDKRGDSADWSIWLTPANLHL